MIANLNKVILAGVIERITPGESGEMRFANILLSTKAVVSTGQDGKKIVQYQKHRIATSGKLADFVNRTLEIGDNIYAEGMIHYGKKVNQEGTQYFTEIRAHEIQFLSRRERYDDDEQD